MAFLPVKAKIGGTKTNGLDLRTDMSGVGNKKVNTPKAGSMGKAGYAYKNPGRKHDGSNPKIARGKKA